VVGRKPEAGRFSWRPGLQAAEKLVDTVILGSRGRHHLAHGARSCEKILAVAAVYDRRILESTTSALIERRYRSRIEFFTVSPAVGKNATGRSFEPRKGRHPVVRMRSAIAPPMPPLPGLTKLVCHLYPTAVRRGPQDVAANTAPDETDAFRLTPMGRWPGLGWIAPLGLMIVARPLGPQDPCGDFKSPSLCDRLRKMPSRRCVWPCPSVSYRLLCTPKPLRSQIAIPERRQLRCRTPRRLRRSQVRAVLAFDFQLSPLDWLLSASDIL